MKRHTQPVLYFILILTVTLIFPSFNDVAAGSKTSLNKLAQQPILYPIPSNTPAEYVPDEILVKFKSEFKSTIKIGTANKGVTVPGIASIDNLNLKLGVFRMERVFKTSGKRINERNNGVSSNDDADLSTIYRLKLKKGGSVPEAVAAYQADPHIEYAEPNYMYYTFETPEDPSFSSQWALHNEGQTGGALDADIDAPEAWDIETGNPDVVIAIVDTGVDWDHPDLGTNIWINSGEDLNGNGMVDDSDFNDIDDDGNGFADDIRGWDFVTASSEIIAPGEDPGPEDNDPMDFHGHGTHCSGIAGAVSNNGEGIAGVAWHCRIMAVRTGYKNIGGLGSLNSTDIANGIVYAADNGADIISMSFGGSTSSNTIMNAVDHAYISGVTLVGAAGNSDSMEKIYPAAYDNVVAVAATDHNDQRSIWTYQASNYGSWVDAAAP